MDYRGMNMCIDDMGDFFYYNTTLYAVGGGYSIIYFNRGIYGKMRYGSVYKIDMRKSGIRFVIEED